MLGFNPTPVNYFDAHSPTYSLTELALPLAPHSPFTHLLAPSLPHRRPSTGTHRMPQGCRRSSCASPLRSTGTLRCRASVASPASSQRCARILAVPKVAMRKTAKARNGWWSTVCTWSCRLYAFPCSRTALWSRAHARTHARTHTHKRTRACARARIAQTRARTRARTHTRRYPGLRGMFSPPAQLQRNGAIVEIADLHQLYKIFERC